MNKHIEILNEISGISPLVAGIDRINVFTVPDGYFETLCDTILICLKEESSPVIIAGMFKGDEIPVDYFNTLAEAVMAKIKAQKEITAAEELNQISAVVAGLNKKNPFQLPCQYFEQLPASILSQTDSDEIPALLTNVRSMQPFELPKGYFENLPTAILNKAQVKQVSKVISLPKRSIFVRYAAAAVITGVLAFSVFKYANKPTDISNTPSTAAQLEPSIVKGKNMDNEKFDETLNNLSEEDIAQYLETNGSDADIAVLTSNVEENDLPKQEDYLLDNTTLDNFLQEIDSKKLEN